MRRTVVSKDGIKIVSYVANAELEQSPVGGAVVATERPQTSTVLAPLDILKLLGVALETEGVYAEELGTSASVSIAKQLNALGYLNGATLQALAGCGKTLPQIGCDLIL